MFVTHARKLLIALLALAATAVAGCGSQAISVPKTDKHAYRGAQLFAERCSGCHTLSAAGTQGSKPKNEINTRDRTNGPNFDQRHEDYKSVLTAIRQGGFSGAVMPGNIVTGEDADDVAKFLDKYSGKSTD
jgi:mono/diheme cytochrome c family protein